MANVPASGIEPGQRRLNGPQSTGREYRNLSRPTHAMAQDDDVAVPMRDGVTLLADVHRPAEPGGYPVLVAASPYPRQIQNVTHNPTPRELMSRTTCSYFGSSRIVVSSCCRTYSRIAGARQMPVALVLPFRFPMIRVAA
jgi:hypothetical protein